MPWKETDKMEQRELFIHEMLKQEKPFKHLCAEFGISEKTGYKWKNRFYEQGNQGLYEQSRNPCSHPNQIDGDTAAELIGIKNAHPAWGPKKIREIYSRTFPNKETPCLSSVNRILQKAGLVKKRKVRRPAASDCPRLQQQIKAEAPNDVWYIDFKGWWKSDGEICEPLTVRDGASKKVLCVRLMQSKSAEAVRAVMTGLFRKYGLPKVIHSDNGSPFSSPNGILNLTKLSAWWITLGILPDRSQKGCPGQNGSLERMHADIANEIEGKVKGGIAANQAVLDEWVKEYNSVRPNEAIGMKTPDEIYTPSPRKYIGDYDEIDYPIGFLPRKVRHTGEISVGSIRVSIGSSLHGLQVGLKPLKEPNTYEVYLADFLLGTLDMNFVCFYPLDGLKSK